MNDVCKLCDADLRGAPIPQESIDKGYYAPGATHFSRLIAIYDWDRDRTVAFQCPDCGGRWDR